jgi:hypothetical protein
MDHLVIDKPLVVYPAQTMVVKVALEQLIDPVQLQFSPDVPEPGL